MQRSLHRQPQDKLKRLWMWVAQFLFMSDIVTQCLISDIWQNDVSEILLVCERSVIFQTTNFSTVIIFHWNLFLSCDSSPSPGIYHVCLHLTGSVDSLVYKYLLKPNDGSDDKWEALPRPSSGGIQNRKVDLARGRSVNFLSDRCKYFINFVLIACPLTFCILQGYVNLWCWFSQRCLLVDVALLLLLSEGFTSFCNHQLNHSIILTLLLILMIASLR